jgi:formylglycine-generating enzyme required for sulfatase activity
MAVRRWIAGAAVLVAVSALLALASRRTAPPTAVSLDRDMVAVPAGWFTMGSAGGPSDERPPRRFYLDAFEIDRTEVTNLQYRRFVLATGASAPRYWTGDSFPPGAELEPVVGVGWTEANAYCEWVGERLPTEAEWEKACRSSDGRTYPWGTTWNPDRANVAARVADDLNDAWAWLVGPRSWPPLGLREVGTCSGDVSAFGVLDLAGNAAEWVADWYSWEGYAAWPDRNPVGLGPPWNRSIRGGAWLKPRSSSLPGAQVARCSTRNSSHSYDDPRVGFRCAASL